MSKVIERAVAQWCLVRHRLLLAADSQEVTLLGVLDLSSAFDCVHHKMLLPRLEIGVGLQKTLTELYLTGFDRF